MHSLQRNAFKIPAPAELLNPFFVTFYLNIQKATLAMHIRLQANVNSKT